MTVGLRTLVLNSSYLPIGVFPEPQTISAEDAMTRVIAGTCHVVTEYERKIKTQNLDMGWPAVIARNAPDQVSVFVALNDKGLYYRDHGVCMYCGCALTHNAFQREHVVPESKGGKFTWDNIVIACGPCNQKKGDQMPTGQWKPKKMPRKPTYHELLENRKKFPLVIGHASWLWFLPEWKAEVIIREAA